MKWIPYCSLLLLLLAQVSLGDGAPDPKPQTGKSYYRWVDEGGQVHFSDRKPMDQGVRDLQVQPLPDTPTPSKTFDSQEVNSFSPGDQLQRLEARARARRRDREERALREAKLEAAQAQKEAAEAQKAAAQRALYTPPSPPPPRPPNPPPPVPPYPPHEPPFPPDRPGLPPPSHHRPSNRLPMFGGGKPPRR